MKFKWDSRYVAMGLTAFIVAICCIFFKWLLDNSVGLYNIVSLIAKALSPVVFALFIAILLDKPAETMERRVIIPMFSRSAYTQVSTKKTRSVSVAIVQLLTWFFIIGLIALVLPQIYRSIAGIISNADNYAASAQAWAENLFKNNPQYESYAVTIINSISSFVRDWIEKSVLPQLNSVITSITGGIIGFLRGILNVLMGIIMSLYLMTNKDTFLGQCKKLLYSIFKPKTANAVIEAATEINRSFGGFFSGKIIDSIIIGLLSSIALTIMKMPYCPLIALLIGVTNIIPVFGPFIGAIPSAIIILFESPVQCLIFIVFIFILQQFDGNILGPRILGSSIGLNAFWIMFAILLFGDLFGFMGMLLGVPTFAVIYNMIKRLTRVNLSEKGLPLETYEYINISSIDPATNAPLYKETKEKESEKAEKPQEKK